MNLIRIISTSLKCGLLAGSLFTLLTDTFEKHIGDEFILLFFLSTMITGIISFCMIIFTIMPFTLMIKDKSTVFKKGFPIYSLIFFLVVFVVSIESNFKMEVFYIIIPAYFTALMAWVWLFKEMKLEENSNID